MAALWTAFVAISWALMSEPATLVVLPAVAVIAVAVVLGDRARAGTRAEARAATPVAFGDRAVASVAAGLATLLAGGEALAAGLALDWPVRHAAFGPLAVACAAAVVAGRFRKTAFAVGVEAAGYVLVGAGLPLASADLPLASLTCAVAGVLMAGTALRPDRRWAGYAGTGLLLPASWLRLLASDISVIEAYAVPFSLVLLGFGWWRARGGKMSSWGAYGPGLVSSLVPSVLALLAGSGWLRPLLLGVVSLAVLLAGARFRLQAPAVLGGLTVAVVALHELAPWIAEVVVLVPRWVPMALGGLLLVVVGATYGRACGTCDACGARSDGCADRALGSGPDAPVAGSRGPGRATVPSFGGPETRMRQVARGSAGGLRVAAGGVVERGRHVGVDGEPGGEAGHLQEAFEDVRYPGKAQPSARLRGDPRATQKYPQPGGVAEGDAFGVDDDPRAVVGDQLFDGLPELSAGITVDVTRNSDHGAVRVPVVIDVDGEFSAHRLVSPPGDAVGFGRHPA